MTKSSINLYRTKENQDQFLEKCREQNKKLAALYGIEVQCFITLANKFDEIINTKYRKG